MSQASKNDVQIWSDPALVWVLFVAATVVLGYGVIDALAQMVHFWEVREEFSHGYLIPLISLFLIWQKKEELAVLEGSRSWLGVAGILIGCSVMFIGMVSATHSLAQYGSVFALNGIALAFLGWPRYRLVMFPFLFLFLMVPLPGIFLFRLSSELQLISSQIGVFVIRLFDISVYLEGNVIDLGKFQLQVVEACNGLRYLFPLMSLALICAYFFQVATWKRVVVFLSSIPITVLMNSFRIGVIGVLVEHWGIEQAQGFLHDFEGWAVFMASVGLILLEMWMFSVFSRDSRPLKEVFGLEFPEPLESPLPCKKRPVALTAYVAVVMVAGFYLVELGLEQRDRVIPERTDFYEFPMVIDEWKGTSERMEQIYLDILKLDDYLKLEFIDGKGGNIGLYSAYYASQEVGEAAHSPKSCLPGGGWRMTDFAEYPVPAVGPDGGALNVNRVVIKKGDYTQLVYYWFQQRGRNITSEYMVKWYLFVDALNVNRTDGALVRLTTFIRPGEDVADADDKLSRFASKVSVLLKDYIPE